MILFLKGFGVNDFADKISSVFSDSSLRAGLVSNSLLSCKKYSLSNVAEDYFKILSGLVV